MRNFSNEYEMANVASVSTGYTAFVAGNLFLNELLTSIYELRWMELLLIILILTDFVYGTIDSVGVRHEDFHISRAGRRTMCKFLEYNAYLATGMVLGMALSEPLGWFSHNISAALGLIFALVCEADSISDHYCSVHCIKRKFSLRKFIIAYLREKFKDIAKAFEESQKETK